MNKHGLSHMIKLKHRMATEPRGFNRVVIPPARGREVSARDGPPLAEREERVPKEVLVAV